MRKLILAGLATLTLTTVAAVSVNKPAVKYQNEYTNLYSDGSVELSDKFLKDSNEFKCELIENYEKLYDTMNEIINQLPDDYYYDVLMETDKYEDYIHYKMVVDSLYETHL